MIRSLIESITGIHERLFARLHQGVETWLPGLLARLVFAAVLLGYFFNSAMLKIGDGLFGVFSVSDSAYFQILPTVVEQYGFDPASMPFFPYSLIVYLGTYSEILLPILVVAGLFTRIAALGMIGFVAVQSYVDIVLHEADPEAVGAWFDRFSDSVILDQRALWLFLLAYLVIYGPGRVSLDQFLKRRRSRSTT